LAQRRFGLQGSPSAVSILGIHQDIQFYEFLRRIIPSQPDVERQTMSQEHYLHPPTVFPAGLDTKVALHPSETLFREGDPGDALYIV
jgi:CRP-like cAMP-binding protein